MCVCADSVKPHTYNGVLLCWLGGDGDRSVCEDEQQAGPHHEYEYPTRNGRTLVIFLSNKLSTTEHIVHTLNSHTYT